MLIEVGRNRPGLVATIAPGQGGRTVALRLPGGENWVDPGTTDWAGAPPGDLRVDKPWAQDFGQVVWLGPQARFWSDQTVQPDRPAHEQGWPPDPICTGATYTVVASAPDRLTLRSPASPVWQVEMTKTWTALADGSMRFEVQARNISRRPIRKGLWFNFRAPPSATVRIPVSSPDAVRLSGCADIRLQYADGWVSLPPPQLRTGETVADAKAFIRPTQGRMCIAGRDGSLQLRFPLTAPRAVAEGHAPVEVYRRVDQSAYSILEVEQHARLVELRPGRTMTHWEIWQWLPDSTG